jgi:S-methylmethionine-dependent homocysteine/selenocysteine methylase
MATFISKRPIVLDGGMSRELIGLNAPFRQPEWTALSLLEGTHFVSQVHRNFINAGADVITTNSYAIVPFHIGEDRFWKSGEDLAALAGRLAREEADRAWQNDGVRVLVAGSLPPIFGSYEPAKFDARRVRKYLEVLVRGMEPYVDIWLGETLSVIEEARAVLDVTKLGGKPVWIAFTPDDSGRHPPNSPGLRSGESIEDVAQWSMSAGIEALLFNCCRPEWIDNIIGITNKVYAENTKDKSVPLLGAYANAFLPRPDDYAANSDICGTDITLTADAYRDFASLWLERGAGIVGGCCGIGHGHIQQLASRFKPSQ